MAEPETPEPTADEVLTGAEEAAAREAQAEAGGGSRTASPTATAKDSASGPHVVRPRARTSIKTAGAPPVEPSKGSSRRRGTTTTGTSLPAELPRSVSGETITVTQGGVPAVTATNVDVRQGGIGRARATDIAVSQGGVGAARADRVSVELGAIGAAMSGELTVTQGAVGSVLARDARIEQSVVRTMIANHVHVERTTGVLFMIARRVEGDVRVLFDWRGAAAFGAAFGVVVSLFRRRR